MCKIGDRLLDFSTEVSSYPDDDMPIQSKGDYQFDFDNLDSINPFLGSVKTVLSPARPAVQSLPTESQHTQPKDILEEPSKIESALDETLLFTPSVENSLVDISTDISSNESSVVTVAKVPAVEEQDSCTATPDEKQPERVSPRVDQDRMSDSFMDDAPLPAKGAYILNFDNLDAVNPFQTGVSKIGNFPVLGRKVPDISPPVEETPETENKPTDVFNAPEAAPGPLELVDFSIDVVSSESSVVTAVTPPADEVRDSCTATSDEKQPAKMSPTAEQDKMSDDFMEDAPLLAKGAYTMDFDNLDAVNPFQTGGSKFQNPPVLVRKVPDISPPVEETPFQENKPPSVVIPEVPVQPEKKPVAAVAPVSANAATTPAAESTTLPADAPIKEEPVKLEFIFDDGSEIKRKLPPKKFGKRLAGVKPKENKPECDVKPTKKTSVMPDASDVADVRVSKGAYSFDFDKLDDPNYNPFGSNAGMNNNLECGKGSGPVLMETSIPERADKPVEKEAASSAWYVYLFSRVSRAFICSEHFTCQQHLISLQVVCAFALRAAESVPAAAESNPGAVRELMRFNTIIIHLTSPGCVSVCVFTKPNCFFWNDRPPKTKLLLTKMRDSNFQLNDLCRLFLSFLSCVR